MARKNHLTKSNLESPASFHDSDSSAQSYLRQILDINPNLIFAKDRSGRFTLVNKAVADIFGTTIEELLGKTDADVNKQTGEVEHFRNDDLEVIESLQEKFIAEEMITDCNGKRRWLQTIKRPILLPDGTANEILGVATDISKLKEVEELLIKTATIVSKQSGTRLFESIAMLLYEFFELPYTEISMYSSDHMQIETYFFSALGRSQLLTKRINPLGPMSELALRKNGLVVLNRIDFDKEFFSSPQQENLCNHIAIYPLFDSEDQPVGIFKVGYNKDPKFERPFDSIVQIITSRIARELQRIFTEQEMRISEAKFRNYFESPLVGIAISRADGSFLDFNEKFCEIFGYRRTELLSKQWINLVHPEDLATSDFLELDPTRSLSVKKRYLHKDGHVIHTLLSAGALNSDDENPSFLAIVQDITPQVEAAEENARLQMQFQESQKLESLGVLAGGIAHDFNNILMGILGNASIALSEIPRSHPLYEAIEKIQLSGQRASELTNQILAYAGKGKYEAIQLDLEKLTTEMFSLLQSGIGKNVSLKCVCEQPPKPVLADPTQIRQVVMNLITNAAESLEGKDGEITIKITNVSQAKIKSTEISIIAPARDTAYVCLSVGDSGSGINGADFHKIFEPFHTTKATGHGLGLSAVLGIVRAHNGALGLRSDPGKGTTFRIFLPVADYNKNKAETTLEPENVPTSQRSTVVLVIDDEQLVRDTVTMMLKHLGFQAKSIAEGRIAVAQLRSGKIKPGLILLDLSMPDISGIEALRQIREFDQTTPVILSSGYSEADVGSVLENATTPTIFLQKPYTSAQLMESIQSLQFNQG